MCMYICICVYISYNKIKLKESYFYRLKLVKARLKCCYTMVRISGGKENPSTNPSKFRQTDSGIVFYLTGPPALKERSSETRYKVTMARHYKLGEYVQLQMKLLVFEEVAKIAGSMRIAVSQWRKNRLHTCRNHDTCGVR